MILSLLGIYLLMFMVPVAELSTRFAGFYIPIVPVTGALLAIPLLFTRQIGRFWRTRIAKPWMAMLVLFFAAAVLGTYPRMSTSFMLQYGARFHILPFFACAFAFTTRQVRQCIYWICGGALLLLILCAKLGEYEEGRLLIPNTTLANSNDLAFALLLGSTCLLLFLYSSSKILRVIGIAALSLSVVFILKTGSRANLVTLVSLAIILFIMSSWRAKFAMLILTPVAILVLALAVPRGTLTRLLLISIHPTINSVNDPQLQGAIGSQIARTELQKRALELTLHHPVLGVGALMFANGVEDMVRKDTGEKSGWQGAHNTYLQISAENGVPALILYVWILVLCFQMNYASYKKCKQGTNATLTGQSLCLFLMTVAHCVGVAFCNAAYDPHTDVLIGLTTANFLAIRAEAGGNDVAFSRA